jgi:hypothetical protein
MGLFVRLGMADPAVEKMGGALLPTDVLSCPLDLIPSSYPCRGPHFPPRERQR